MQRRIGLFIGCMSVLIGGTRDSPAAITIANADVATDGCAVSVSGGHCDAARTMRRGAACAAYRHAAAVLGKTGVGR